MNRIKQFFWLCSGSHIPLLEQAPTEAAKYAGIGATIFFTGIFASLASSYSIYTFTGNIWTSIIIGIVWGGMIFNLDRYIVSSMRKANSWKKEWILAWPRIFLALLISLVIAKPLELKIFEKEINTEISLINDEMLIAKRDSTNDYFRGLVDSHRADINILLLAIANKQKLRDELRAEASVEADGTGGSMRRNAGPIYKIKAANANVADEELKSLTVTIQALIAGKRQLIDSLRKENRKQLAASIYPDYTGFAARLEALERLTDKNVSLGMANAFIILLFIAIETAPVLVKLISSKGPYDYLLEIEEYNHELVWLSKKARLNSKTRKTAKQYTPEEYKYIDQYLSSNFN